MVIIVTLPASRPINWPITLNSIHKNHNNLSDKGTYLLMIKKQIPTKASNAKTMWFCEMFKVTVASSVGQK